MADNPNKPIILFTALASATGAAYAIAYVAHFEWHFSRVVVRTDALIMAAIVGVVFGLKILLQGWRKSGS